MWEFNKEGEVTHNTEMWFGQHKGKKMVDVPAEYLVYMYESNKAFGRLKDYIHDNLETLKSEIKQSKKP